MLKRKLPTIDSTHYLPHDRIPKLEFEERSLETPRVAPKFPNRAPPSNAKKALVREREERENGEEDEDFGGEI